VDTLHHDSTTFLGFAEKMVPVAKAQLFRDKFHAPILHVFDAKWDCTIAMLGGDTGGRPMHEYVEAVCRKLKAVAFLMINEAWMGTGITKEQLETGKFVRPSKLPLDQRNEALILQVAHPKGTAMWITNFIRGVVIDGEQHIAMDETKFIIGPEVLGGMKDVLTRIKERP